MLRCVLCALAVLALLVVGCSKEEPEVVAASPSETPSPTESPSPEPPPIGVLTGEELLESNDRPVLAVKIDNAPAALPPDGIEDADIVIEEEVEGGITRFLALYHSEDPAEVGPVRSGREADVELLVPFRPVLALSGAAKSVEGMFRHAGVPFFQEGEAEGAFHRVDDRIAPHNLFATTETLWEQGDDLELLDEPVFTFSEDVPDDGRDVESVELTYSPYADAVWTWTGDGWEREQNGEPHEVADGGVIRADNVIVMRVESRPGTRTDKLGNPTLELDVIGKGRATFFRDGQEFKGRWEKESRQDQLVWLTNDGDDFELRPGQTFIQILPTDDFLTTTKPSDASEGSEGSEGSNGSNTDD